LAQTCDHLSYFAGGSLDGPTYRVPWILKVLLGRFVIRRILSTRKMSSGVPTPQKPLPRQGGDASAAIARFNQTLERMDKHQGEFHDHPFFGHLTPQQTRDLHQIHCAHHLAYLFPKPAPVVVRAARQSGEKTDNKNANTMVFENGTALDFPHPIQ